ncbi:Acyl-coenzyme A thioesterase [Arachis hypogaea]|nr:Acyl-coenzyme A thioesterase [Arachis hypogaea]
MCEEDVRERNGKSISCRWIAMEVHRTFVYEWPPNSSHGACPCALLHEHNATFTPVIPSPMTSGVSVEINVSYFDAAYLHEEIEIDARLLRFGKAVAVVSVEFRKKKSGKIFAQGRHTKYLALASKL